MFVKLNPDHVNWDCYLIKTTGKRIGWKKSGFVFFSLNSFFFASFAYAVCTMWNNNYVMNISKLPRVIINCTCDMEQQLFANTWFNYQFTETKKLFDEELFCILWVTIFLTECKSFDTKLGEIVTVLNWI